MKTVALNRTVPVTGEYDTVVCGGGPAGWVAAVSAARAGRRTALVEKLSFFGGTATAGYVVPVSGFHFRGERVVGGIAWEFIERMQAAGAALVEYPRGHVSVNVETYKQMAAEMLLEAGVELYTNCTLTDCIRDGGRITHIIFAGPGGNEALAARVFIDATGNGELCAMAGVPMLPVKGELQPVSLGFVLAGVDCESELMRDCIHHTGLNKKLVGSANTMIREYLNEIAEERGLQFGGPWFNTLLGRADCVAVNMTRAAVDVTDRAALTRTELTLRREMLELIELMRERFPEFRRCELAASGVSVGVRESRHIRGLRTLTDEDLHSAKPCVCPVAHCAHPIDIHAAHGSGQQLHSLKQDLFVPYATMVSDTTDNLIAAGRCISAEGKPFASLRVQATLMSIGEAAGVAAALADGRPVYALPTDELCSAFAARGFVC